MRQPKKEQLTKHEQEQVTKRGSIVKPSTTTKKELTETELDGVSGGIELDSFSFGATNP